MKQLRLISLFLLSFSSIASEKEYVLIQNGEYLYMNVINNTNHNISVEDFFCLSLPAKISFEIFYENGTQLKRVANISDKCELEKYVDLQPAGMLGRKIHIETLLNLYGYKTGAVRLRATVCSDGDNDSCSTTNSLTIDNMVQKP